jgi:phage terminase large subunit GpA-like protein
LKRGHIPAAGLILTGAADVQMMGIWYSIKAWAPDGQSWVVDAGYISGGTDDPHAGAFAELEKIRVTQWPDAYGRTRTVDLFGVDSGYRAHVVYTWVRGKAATFALKGEDGWSRPAIGQPSPVDIDFKGKRIRNGAMVWAVGTWPLKGAFYAQLRKEGIAAGQPVNPPGYCHFLGGRTRSISARSPRNTWPARPIAAGSAVSGNRASARKTTFSTARSTTPHWPTISACRA